MPTQINEFRSALMASAIMIVASFSLLYARLSGTPFFENVFEVCLFHFPAAILVCYSIYLRIRRPSKDRS
ncbi:MAG: hypothetical protein QFX35_04015 [Candidatus Verstraetearchaeota archaeon]|nr:hypothetical protein [Candidatus Verstraetearchaeota archaeon]